MRRRQVVPGNTANLNLPGVGKIRAALYMSGLALKGFAAGRVKRGFDFAEGGCFARTAGMWEMNLRFPPCLSHNVCGV